jgi:hypothetical protein
MPQTITSYMVETDGFELTCPHDRQGNLPWWVDSVIVIVPDAVTVFWYNAACLPISPFPIRSVGRF